MAQSSRKPKAVSESTTKSARASATANATTSAKSGMKPKVRQSDKQQVSFLPKEDDPDFLQLFRRLVDATPRDSNGFLQYFLDSTLIPHNLEDRPPDKQSALVLSAKLPLSMLEGYHSFQDTKPVWTNLPHEPRAYFEAFRAYLLSPSRSLATTGNDLDFEVPGFTPYTLNEAYTLFYWQDRARAYDILKPVAAARLRDQRLLQTEDAHYLLTNDVLRQLQDEIKARSDDDEDNRPWAGLKASELVAALSTMMQMQRVSLGLPSHGPKLRNEAFQPAPFGGTDRAIRESAQNYLGTTEAGLTQAQKMQQDINRTLAEDPNAAAALQAVALDIMLKARAVAHQQANQEAIPAGHPQGYGPPPGQDG